LKLTTFNTSVINTNIDAISAEVRRLDPDIAILMEFNDRKRAVLDKIRDLYPYDAGCVPRRHCHFLMLSKLPFESAEVREGWNGPLMVRVKLGAELGGLNIVGVHAPRPPHVADQFSQMMVLEKYLEKLTGEIVVMGDFNATPYSRLLKDFAERMKLQRLTNLPSWPTVVQLPQLPIDHFFVSGQIRLLERPRIGRPAGSDHYPVTVTVAVRSR
jgi:endonuclease/exonuclease/phosphatase (EEP) superfamily protein YafD